MDTIYRAGKNQQTIILNSGMDMIETMEVMNVVSVINVVSLPYFRQKMVP